ncbi:MAG: DUF1559 domain-containing protein [Planctomycetaceae bacterium]|nr:DUF1559 domain-containing protein [Planctomycetaceae bacterium]
MTQRQAFVSWSAFLVLVGAALVGPSLFGQAKPGPSPEKLLPAGTLLYVGWDGTDAHRDAWQKTAAYDAIFQSGLSEVVTKLAAWAERQAGEASVRMVIDSLAHLGHKGVYLAVAVPAADQGPPLPQLTVVVPEAGGATKELSLLLDQLGIRDFNTRTVESRQVTRGRIPTLPAAEVGWWAEGGHLVIAAGIGAVDAALQVAAGRAPHLGENPVYKKYQAKADFDVALVSWIDLATIRQLTGGIPLSGSNPNEPGRVADVLKALGLENVGPAASRVGFKDEALWSETTITAPAPRSGILAFAEQKPLSLTELPALPAGADGFYSGRLDWSQAAAGMQRMSEIFLKLFGPQGSPTGDQLLAQVKQHLGVDLQKDLFDPLGDVMVLYGDTRQGLFGMGMGLALSVDDPKTLRSTVDKLLTRLMQSAGGDVKVQSVKRGTRTITFLEFPKVPVISPALAIDDKWLVIGLYPQTAESFLLRQDGTLPRWKTPESVTKALALLPEKYTSFTFSDPREGLQTAIGLAPTLISYAQMGLAEQRRRQFGPDAKIDLPVSMADFPPAEVVTRKLFPNVSVCSVTGNEIRWTSRTSFPAVPLLGGAGIGSGGTAAPVLVALLLPAVQQAREAARRSQSKNNLKQIGLAMHNFHDVYNGFPAGTHQNDKLKAEKRLSWLADILPFIDQAPLYAQIDFKKAWVDEPNERVAQSQVPVYLNPSVPILTDGKYAVSHYVGIAGVGKDAPLLPVTDKRAGILGYNRITRIQNITDGTSNTMAVAEAGKEFGPWSAGGPSTGPAPTKSLFL